MAQSLAQDNSSYLKRYKVNVRRQDSTSKDMVSIGKLLNETFAKNLQDTQSIF